MLKKNKIVVLDEPTANIDPETEEFIFENVFEFFEDCTVIMIAHKLSHISKFDRVLVMEDGEIAEYDSPYCLLVNNFGDKEITNTKGVFARMVERQGTAESKLIF